MASQNFGGTLFFKINGVAWNLGATFKLDLGGITRTARSNIDGSSGFTTKYRPAMWEVELSGGQGVSLATLQGLTSTTFTATLDNGMTYVMTDGWTEDVVSLDVAESKISLKIAGQVANEVPG